MIPGISECFICKSNHTNDESTDVLFLNKGTFVGKCPKCGQISTHCLSFPAEGYVFDKVKFANEFCIVVLDEGFAISTKTGTTEYKNLKANVLSFLAEQILQDFGKKIVRLPKPINTKGNNSFGNVEIGGGLSGNLVLSNNSTVTNKQHINGLTVVVVGYNINLE